MTKQNAEVWLTAISFIMIYFVWGSTYLANAWAIETVPPFLLAGSRFIVAGGSMFLIGLMFGAEKVTLPQLKNSAFAGFMLFAIGNGLIVWALQYVDSGMTALLVAFEPLIVTLLMWRMKQEKPKWYNWVGILLGILGMLFLVGQPHLASNANFLIGVFAILVAMVSWGYISIWITDANLPAHLFQSAALQMFWGGVILLLVSLLHGDFKTFDYHLVTSKTLWSLLYLIIFGSILAFTSYNYLLTKISPTKIATATYVNPVVALFLGWWLNHESISGQSLFAGFLLLSGVIFIHGKIPMMKRRFKK